MMVLPSLVLLLPVDVATCVRAQATLLHCDPDALVVDMVRGALALHARFDGPLPAKAELLRPFQGVVERIVDKCIAREVPASLVAAWIALLDERGPLTPHQVEGIVHERWGWTFAPGSVNGCARHLTHLGEIQHVRRGLYASKDWSASG